MTAQSTPSAPLKSPVLTGRQTVLRGFLRTDVTDRYVQWLNDPKVNQYLESRFAISTLETARAFVESKLDRHDCQMFAILTKDSQKHIGNIKIDPIYWVHRRAEIGLLIGDLEHTGHGHATEAISLLKTYAFQELKLHKLTAGCYLPNVGSVRAFEKAGFAIEATIKRHSTYNGNYVDCYLLAAFNE